jgi:Flp pilus assembly pilin Flp
MRKQRRIRTARQRLLLDRLRDDRGATSLEFALLLAVIVLPSYVVIRMGLQMVGEHFRLIVTLNALPMP